ncbi:dephospho-CoA kinase, partial [Micromonospora aurantiaca (nom. illeg.)]|uniref:dephospho-CoA kinase n=1 Tax=Micromonospora aurantiaca (nom. illeg.) TaxID=47850 RepID=UPI00381AA436
MLKVGLTGGIGSGKSAVGSRLATQGAGLVDSDRRARALVAPGPAASGRSHDRTQETN